MPSPESGPAPSTDPAGDPLVHARALAHLLDSAVRIPGTTIRVGLDPLLGLLPGLGDAAGACLAGYIVILAARLGAGSAVILRMLGNLAVDALAGAVPLLGDLFDIGWRSNTRNVALLERYLANPSAARRSSALVVGGVVLALAGLVAGGVILTVLVVRLFITAVR